MRLTPRAVGGGVFQAIAGNERPAPVIHQSDGRPAVGVTEVSVICVRKLPQNRFGRVAFAKRRWVCDVQCKKTTTAATQGPREHCAPGLGFGIESGKEGIADGRCPVHIEVVVVEVGIAQAVIAGTDAVAKKCAGRIGDHLLAVAGKKAVHKSVVGTHIDHRGAATLSRGENRILVGSVGKTATAVRPGLAWLTDINCAGVPDVTKRTAASPKAKAFAFVGSISPQVFKACCAFGDITAGTIGLSAKIILLTRCDRVPAKRHAYGCALL